MKFLTVAHVSILSLFLFSCGRSQEELAKLEDPTGGNNSNLVCDLTNLSDSTANCAKVTYQNQVLAETKVSQASLTMVASKKNGGAGGSFWYNSAISSTTPVNLQLPASIDASGNAGNGQKLYILFNNSIDCAWFSNASVRYNNFRCFQGATRNAGNAAGFTGGTELFLGSISNVTKAQMTVSGSSGSGVITTATAIFPLF